MKQIINKIIPIILLICLGKTQAQSTIVSIKHKGYTRETNYYYKDIDNELDAFQGTYIYSNGNTWFKIVLVKKVNQYNGRYYEDMIIGEYEYKENGVTIASTLNKIDTVYSNQISHKIDGNSFIKKNNIQWKCPDCADDELRFSGSIMDVNTMRYAYFIARKRVVGSQEFLDVKIGPANSVTYTEGGPLPPNFNLPQGVMTFVKQ